MGYLETIKKVIWTEVLTPIDESVFADHPCTFKENNTKDSETHMHILSISDVVYLCMYILSEVGNSFIFYYPKYSSKSKWCNSRTGNKMVQLLKLINTFNSFFFSSHKPGQSRGVLQHVNHIFYREFFTEKYIFCQPITGLKLCYHCSGLK